MSEQIKSRTVTKYECPICHKEYDDEVMALRCASRISEVDKQVAEFKPWHWYRLESHGGCKVMILPYKAYKSEGCRTRGCLVGCHLRTHDSQEPYIYSDEDWDIFEGPISLEEAWKKYKICPEFKRTRELYDVPPDVSEKFDRLRETVANALRQDIQNLKDYEKDELLFRLVEQVVMRSNVRPYNGIQETLFNKQIDKEFRKS